MTAKEKVGPGRRSRPFPERVWPLILAESGVNPDSWERWADDADPVLG